MARNVRRAAMRAQKDARPLEHGHQDLDRDLEPDDVARVVQEAPCARARVDFRRPERVPRRRAPLYT